MKFSDTVGSDTAYLHHELPVMDRSEIHLGFDLSLLTERSASISLIHVNQGTRQLAEVFLSPENTFSMVVYSGNLYPSYDLYPSRILYPSVAGFNDPRVALHRTSDEVSLNLYVRNPGIDTDVDLYVESGDRHAFASFNSVNWKDLDVDGVDVGCVSNEGTMYEFDINNLILEGDREGEWYNISGYDGFDTDVLWQAAIDTENPDTYTSYRDLRKLARYDSARPETTPTIAKGIYWRRNNA